MNDPVIADIHARLDRLEATRPAPNLRLLYLHGQYAWDETGESETFHQNFCALQQRMCGAFLAPDLREEQKIDHLLEGTMPDMMEACIKRVTSLITTFKPDVIMGHSHGAGVLVWLVARGIWRGPAIVSAPGYAQLLAQQDIPGCEPANRLEDPAEAHDLTQRNSRVLLAVGEEDKAVSPDNVRHLADAWIAAGVDVRCDVLQGVGHGLPIVRIADPSQSHWDALFEEYLSWTCQTDYQSK